MILEPINNLDAEQSVIAAIIIDGLRTEYVITAYEHLHEDYFYNSDIRLIYTTIKQLVEEQSPVDVVTLASRLKNHKEFLVELMANGFASENIKHYVSMLKDFSIQRKYAEALRAAYNAMNAPRLSHNEKLDRMNGLISEVDSNGTRNSSQRISELLDEVVIDLDDMLNNNKIAGMPTGYHDLDKEIGGLDDGELIVIGARPSVGKSTIGMNIAEHISKHNGDALYITMEMTNKEMTQRSICSQGRIDNHIMRNPKLASADDWTKISKAVALCKDMPLHFLDMPRPTVQDIKQEARSFMRRNGMKVLFIDHLHLINHKGISTVEGIADTTANLKGLAQELNIPIVLLAQLNRGNAKDERMPAMTDLRGSGAIEQDANKIFLLHSDEENYAGKLLMYVAKNRNGVRDVGVVLASNLQYFRFDNLAHGQDEAY